MDLRLAAYKAGKHHFIDPPKPLTAMFPRKRITTLPDSRGTLDLIAKQLRDSTWRRHESHQKQLKYHLDRQKYMQTKTWQQEYDNLRIISHDEQLPHARARVEALKRLLGTHANDVPYDF